MPPIFGEDLNPELSPSWETDVFPTMVCAASCNVDFFHIFGGVVDSFSFQLVLDKMSLGVLSEGTAIWIAGMSKMI